MGARAVQIVADEHPERFTWRNEHLFFDRSSTGTPWTEAVRPETIIAPGHCAKSLEPGKPMTDAQAKAELETLKVIIDRQPDMRWLAMKREP